MHFPGANKDIQYMTQVQDDKDAIGERETYTVFDVTSQQFYVDVGNASNLIVPPGMTSLKVFVLFFV